MDPRPKLTDALQGPTGAARIFDAFLVAARAQPSRVALAHAHGSWTYAQLERASHALAAHLASRVAADAPVALYGRRTPELIVGMLGCLRAGRPFAVLDAAYPAERLALLLDLIRPGLLVACTPVGAAALAEDSTALQLPLPAGTERLDAEGLAALLQSTPGAHAPIDQARPESTAYLLFTSGTTGAPKCIKTSHAPLVHFVEWYAQAFAVDDTARFSMLSGLAHDPVLRDVFVPLSCGAQVHVPAQAALRDPRQLFAWCQAAGITHAHVTPQLSRILCSGRGDGEALRSLRYLLSGGDALRHSQVQAVRQAAPQAQVINFYGATETPQAMGFHRVQEADLAVADAIPVGRGIADAQLLVLNESLQPAALGAPGQIAIRTRFLSSGYLGDAALTQAKFVVNPARQDPTDTLYLTGDSGYVRADGAVVATGRLDDQVKIRGYRVELAEVVRHVERLEAVQSAVVLAQAGSDGENRLMAYCVAAHPEATQPPSEGALRAQLAATIPGYMVPFRFVWLAALPLLPNGKIDRARLREAVPTRAESADADTDSADPTVAALAACLGEVLGLERIPASASFLQLGGDSLSFIRAGMQVERLLGTLPPGWEGLTLTQLATHRRAGRGLLTRVETPVLIRALSIVSIVAAHLEMPEILGSTVVLFMVSGMSFGRYSASAVLRAGGVAPVLQLAARIAVPTVLYTVLLDLLFDTFRWQALFMLGNFSGSTFEDRGFHFWFVEVLTQNLLLLAGLLSLPRVRAAVRQHPFTFPMAAAWGFAALAVVAPFVWDTSDIYDHVPHMYLGSMFLGWAMAHADTPRRRGQVAAGLAATLAAFSWREGTVMVLPFLAALTLIYRRQVLLPRDLGRVVNLLAGASLFIYLTDFQVASWVSRSPGGDATLVQLGACLAAGVGIWRLWEAVLGRVGALFKRRPQAGLGSALQAE